MLGENSSSLNVRWPSSFFYTFSDDSQPAAIHTTHQQSNNSGKKVEKNITLMSILCLSVWNLSSILQSIATTNKKKKFKTWKVHDTIPKLFPLDGFTNIRILMWEWMYVQTLFQSKLIPTFIQKLRHDMKRQLYLQIYVD